MNDYQLFTQLAGESGVYMSKSVQSRLILVHVFLRGDLDRKKRYVVQSDPGKWAMFLHKALMES